MKPMSRGVIVRLLLVLGLLAGCAYLAIDREPRLGIDLRGGTQLTLETESTDKVEANAENTDKAIEVLRGRVDAIGVAEPTLARIGANRILIELPDVQNKTEAEDAVGRTAQLSIHPVLRTATPEEVDQAGLDRVPGTQ